MLLPILIPFSAVFFVLCVVEEISHVIPRNDAFYAFFIYVILMLNGIGDFDFLLRFFELFKVFSRDNHG